MLKRRYSDFEDWSIVSKKHVKISYINNRIFRGYFSILYIDEVIDLVNVSLGNRNITVANDGYMWVQFFPMNRNHCITSMFEHKREIIMWKIDITKQNGIREDDEVPFFDDLFLDIFILPSFEVFLLDEDQLLEALQNKIISKQDYTLAYKESTTLIDLVNQNNTYLTKLSNLCLKQSRI